MSFNIVMLVMPKKFLFTTSAILLLFISNIVLAINFSNLPETEVMHFRLPQRVSIWGYLGSHSMILGQNLVPVYGDSNKVLFTILDVDMGFRNGHNGNWLIGAGLNYRQMLNSKIFGGRFTGNYYNTARNNKFWFGLASLEMLSSTWDVIANGYIPVGIATRMSKEFTTSDSLSASLLSSSLEHKFIEYDSIRHGFDLNIGRTIPRFELVRMYLGGYHFNGDEIKSINGGQVKLAYDFCDFAALSMYYDYDNKSHNQFFMGLRLTHSNYQKDEKQKYGISTRLIEPIDANLTIIGQDILSDPVVKSL